jgi:SHS2 domain-containing protein
MKPRRHWFGEHVGEIRVRAEAPTLHELFEEAGRALAELLAEGAEDGSVSTRERVDLEERDPSALLIGWLNELIFRSERTKLVYDDLCVEITGARLAAAIRGHRPIRARTAVKAATMHDVHIDETPDGFSASVVLDV